MNRYSIHIVGETIEGALQRISRLLLEDWASFVSADSLFEGREVRIDVETAFPQSLEARLNTLQISKSISWWC